jgi:hypothetical protein
MKLALVALAMLVAATAAAEPLTVGVFAPAAPFDGNPARVAFASRLAAHLEAATDDEVIGRVYARAADLAAAVRRGEVQITVVDAPYLATRGGDADVLAVAITGGASSQAWQLVAATAATRALDLRGRALLVPTIGGREPDLVGNALFGGELPPRFWRAVTAAPDAASAVAAIGLGRADAAVVPAGIALPAGVRVVMVLPRLPAPIAVGHGLGPRRAHIAAALLAYRGDGAITGFATAADGVVAGLAARLAPPVRRGPLIVPPLALPIGELVGGRAFAIGRADVRSFAAPPEPVAGPAPSRK